MGNGSFARYLAIYLCMFRILNFKKSDKFRFPLKGATEKEAVIVLWVNSHDIYQQCVKIWSRRFGSFLCQSIWHNVVLLMIKTLSSCRQPSTLVLLLWNCIMALCTWVQVSEWISLMYMYIFRMIRYSNDQSSKKEYNGFLVKSVKSNRFNRVMLLLLFHS